ncbi:MAG: patatin-like phospholipase family protein [Planctomycetales bacterium]|nr:patatin-like phospholipase family protein [Planctomycetales bacterium]
MPTAAKTIRDVKDQELLAIRERRAVHVATEAASDAPQVAPDDSVSRRSDAPEPQDLTGLALSGGGIRAAAFSLGFIQAMCRTGRMKAFDYMSTVSGGGYAGCLFSSTVARRKNRINWERNGKYNRLDFEQNEDGSQPDTVKRLSLHGRMMGNFLRLLSRHLWGFLVNATFTISGIVAIAAILAYIMRIPWDHNMLPVLSELGFNNDLAVAFFFTFLMFQLWIASHAFMYVAKLLGRKVAPVTQLTYLLLIASVALGIINVLAIGDIDIGGLFAGRGGNAKLQAALNNLVSWIGLAISGAFATSLLPYLSPKRLMESGNPDAGRIQSLIFRAASNGLVIGAPLVIYFFLVHEDISGWNHNRPDSDLLTASHFSPVDFAAKLESQTTSDNPMQAELARVMYEGINGKDFEDKEFVESSVEFGELLKEIRSAGEQKRIDDKEYGLISRCCLWLANAIRLNERFSERVKAMKEMRAKSEEVTRRFNERIVSSPHLFVDLLGDQAEADRRHPLLDLFKSTESSGVVQNLLGTLGLPAGRPTLSADNSLEIAIEAIQSGTKQLNVRYRLGEQEFDVVPNADEVRPDRKQQLAVLVLLARQAANERSIVEPAAPTIDPPPETQSESTENPVSYPKVKFYAVESLSGQFVSKLQELLHDDGLRNQIEKKLKLLNLPSSFEGEEQKRTFAEWQSKHALVVDELSRQIRTNNWKILNSMYPQEIRSSDTVFAYTVNAQDQAYRLKIALWAAMIFVGIGFITNLNNTSLHGVYRDQLAEIWLSDPQIQVHELENACKNGAPFHLVNGTVNRMGHRLDPDTEGKSRFTFSHRYCGTNKVGFRETKQYNGGDMRLADVMAISGGAVTSVNSPTLLHQLILFLTNCRLGQWLPNPQTYKEDFYWPSPIRALAGMLSRPEQRSHFFVSDGGHIDNTGLAPLLERRCRLMMFVDSSYDPKYEFSNLLSVMHDARAKYGVTFEPYDGKSSLPVDKVLDRLRPSEEEHGQSESHFVAFTVHYPECDAKGGPVAKGILICCKLTVTGDEPIEIVEETRGKGAFPHHPTTDQLLPPEIFEAYLMLGRHVGEQVDTYVADGNLDCFDVPRAWHGDQASDPDPEPASSSVARKEAAHSESFREVEQELRSLPFDKPGIARVTEILNHWCRDHLEPVARSMRQSHANCSESDQPENSIRIDTSIFEMVSNWARDDDRGIDAPRGLRAEFCAPLLEQIEKHRDAIVRDVAAKKEYRVLLSVVGHGVRNVRAAIRRLSASQDPEQPVS